MGIYGEFNEGSEGYVQKFFYADAASVFYLQK